MTVQQHWADAVFVHAARFCGAAKSREGALKMAGKALELAAALHPTPAVCGYPNSQARELIAEIEPFDRGFFTGMVGWCDTSGDGEWAVTIRCAEVQGGTQGRRRRGRGCASAR